MNLKRRVQLVVGAIVGVAVFAALGSAASAQCYPNCVAALTIDDPTATPGQTLTATATGLDPFTSASGVVNSDPIALGSKQVASNGTVAFSFVVPADYTGVHTVRVNGVSNGRAVTLTANFTVSSVVPVATTVARSTPLARTGDDSVVPLAQIGVGLLALGGAAGYVTRRRRRTTA